MIRFNPYALRFIPAGAGNTVPKSSHTGASTVYPRWRGEHAESMHNFDRENGLSPLARGTQKDIRSPALPNRFIPAGAGNTIICLVARSVDAVYPRWRGEHTSVTVLAAPATGLSPLARGTRKKHGAALVLRWFIPAGAGNTSGYFIEFINITVYPRWRGEHRIGRVDKTQPAGLSPLARGTRPSFSEVSA